MHSIQVILLGFQQVLKDIFFALLALLLALQGQGEGRILKQLA